MGTPEFAVEPLRVILKAGYTIVAVVTAPDKPSGRGQKLNSSPVKEFALAHNLKVLQPSNLKDLQFIDEIRSYGANLQVVVAFRMLPEVIWQMPQYGSVNLHASLLPQYRGAAPINHAIINGETETGLTTFFIEKEIDKGNIIMSKKVIITPEDDAGTLHDRLMAEGGSLIIDTLKTIESGYIPIFCQDASFGNFNILKTAPKIFKENCKIVWNSPSVSIHNFIRGLSPFPGAYTNLVNSKGVSKQVKIYKTSYTINKTEAFPGTIITDKKLSLSVVTKDGLINILELQIEGKRKMEIKEFMKGLNFKTEMFFK